MSIFKYAGAEIDGIWTPRKKSSKKEAADQIEIDNDIPDDFVYDPNKVYSSVRAISARVNDNEDGFDKEELLGNITDLQGNIHPPHNDKFGYRTFIGKNNHIDHANQPEIDHGDPDTNARHAPRGKILWSWFNEDELTSPVDRKGTEDPVVKAAGSDAWVRLLIENDKREFPLLCDLIENGDINKVSMGCEILNSACSVCGNVAHHQFQYCGHVRPEGRGQVFSALNDSPYVKMGVVEAGDPIVAFEQNRGLQFFEESFILETQADPTAVLLDLVRGEPGMSFKEIEAAKSKIGKVRSFEEKKRAAEGEGLNLNINGVDSDQLKNSPYDSNKLDREMEENPYAREMDYTRPPDEQDGVFYPAAPFPCSAWVAADQAAKEQDPEAEDLDTLIDVGMCAGCVYNRSDEAGAVDCSFPEVTREGGKDPLMTGYEPLPTYSSSRLGWGYDTTSKKVCEVCGESQSINNYEVMKIKKSGEFSRRNKCKQCKSEASKPQARQYYWDNREKVIERSAVAKKAQIKKNAELTRKLRNETPCADCKEIYPYYKMQFDHIKGEKDRDVSQMVNAAVGTPRLQREIDKCEIVCANCHAERTHLRKIQNEDEEFVDIEELIRDEEEEDRSTGFRSDDGEEIEVMPGLGNPPDDREDKSSSYYPYIEVAPKYAEEMDRMQMEMFPQEAEQTQLFDDEKYDEGTWNAQHTVSITIPSADSEGNKISDEFFNETVDWVRKEMAQEFGGTSVTHREAGDFYEKSTDEVISDYDLKVIESSTDDVEGAREYIEGLANYLQHYMGQWSIEFAVDGKKSYTSNVYKKDSVPVQEGDDPEDLRKQIEELSERLRKLEG